MAIDTHPVNSFDDILSKYRKYSFSEKDRGERFERIMQAYLHPSLHPEFVIEYYKR